MAVLAVGAVKIIPVELQQVVLETLQLQLQAKEAMVVQE
jgi:hypothetical protein